MPEQQEGGDGAAPAFTCILLPCVPGREPALTLLSNSQSRENQRCVEAEDSKIWR